MKIAQRTLNTVISAKELKSVKIGKGVRRKQLRSSKSKKQLTIDGDTVIERAHSNVAAWCLNHGIDIVKVKKIAAMVRAGHKKSDVSK